MHAKSSFPDSDARHTVRVVEPEIDSDLHTNPWRFFMQLVVVLIGLICGVILAVFIGLTVGWIQIC